MEGLKTISSSGQPAEDTDGFERCYEEQCPAASISPTLQKVVEGNPYLYSPLPKPGSIRLLRLMPGNSNCDITCKLFDYPLQDIGDGECLYEALSYVWGGSAKLKSVLIDGCQLAVTENLYIALLHLRDQYIERILWIDAICINQGNKEEQGHQVRYMARIYCKASRVIVWLGEKTDKSDQALKAIRLAAETGSEGFPDKEESGKEILALLKRDWFQRIWVLQEVAAARHILIMCCSTTMDGYAFCLGLESSKIPYNAFQEQHLRNVIRSISYLIKGSIFRPKYTTTPSGAISLGIRTLGELIDMYHTREATEPLDKVFALLGMSSDDYGAALSPDYTMSIGELMCQLVKFILGKHVFVKTWHNKEVIAIKAKGCVLGIVSSVEGSDLHDRQQIFVKSKYASGKNATIPESKWILQPSANSVHVDDIVCFLEGASKPTIIRFCRDHFFVLMITVRPQQIADEIIKKWESDSIASFSLEFLLVWDWAKLQEDLQSREYEKFIENRTQENSIGEFEGLPNKASRLWNAALILEEAEYHEASQERLREALNYCECDLGAENLRTITIKERLALVLWILEQLEEARELLEQVVKARIQLQGANHPETRSAVVNTASIAKDQGHLEEDEVWEFMIDIFQTDGNDANEKIILFVQICESSHIQFLLALNAIQVTERLLTAALENEDSEDAVLGALLQWIKQENMDPEILISENVLKTAAEHSEYAVSKIYMLLESFHQNGKDSKNHITEGVLKAAVGNEKCGLEIVKTLLESLGQEDKDNKNKITEDVLIAAVRNGEHGLDIVKTLLESLGQDAKNGRITGDVLRVAVGNRYSANDIVKLLLEQLPQKTRKDRITEDLLHDAAGNCYSGKDIVHLLLAPFDEKTKQDLISTKVLEAATRNYHGGEAILKLFLGLLDRKRKQDRITEDILRAALGGGQGILKLLLEPLDRGNKQARITEVILEAAATSFEYRNLATLLESLDHKDIMIKTTKGVLIGAVKNQFCAVKMTELLFNALGNERTNIQISEDILVAAVKNSEYREEHKNWKKLINILFEWGRNETQVTEKVLVEAALQRDLDAGAIKLLLKQEVGKIPITEAGLLAVMSRGFCPEASFEVLINEAECDQITETVLIRTISCGSEYYIKLQMCLRRIDYRLTITETLLAAAVANSYPLRVLQHLLGCATSKILIKEAVLVSAAGNTYFRESDLKIFLGGTDNRFEIAEGALTEAVLVAALRRKWYRIEVLRLLLNYADGRVHITEHLITALETSPEPGKYELRKEVAREMIQAHKEKYESGLTGIIVEEAGKGLGSGPSS